MVNETHQMRWSKKATGWPPHYQVCGDTFMLPDRGLNSFILYVTTAHVRCLFILPCGGVLLFSGSDPKHSRQDTYTTIVCSWS